MLFVASRKKNHVVEKNGLFAQKKTSACAVSALLRTRIDQGVPQGRFLDPTTVRWACKPRPHYWLPAGTPSVRQKDRRFTNTAEVCTAVAGRTEGLYHALDLDAREANAGFSREARPW